MYHLTFIFFLGLTYRALIALAVPASSAATPTAADVSLRTGSTSLAGEFNINKGTTYYEYKVPDTEETVDYYLGGPMDADAMKKTLQAAYNELWMHIHFEGDGHLPQNYDPFIFDASYGAAISVQSMPGHSLTWSYVRSAVGGMHDLLYLAGRYNQVRLEILDIYDGLVGEGRLVATPLDNVTIDSQTEASF